RECASEAARLLPANDHIAIGPAVDQDANVLVPSGYGRPQVAIRGQDRDTVEFGGDGQLEDGGVHVHPRGAVTAGQPILLIADGTEERYTQTAELNRNPLLTAERQVHEAVEVSDLLEIVGLIDRRPGWGAGEHARLRPLLEDSAVFERSEGDAATATGYPVAHIGFASDADASGRHAPSIDSLRVVHATDGGIAAHALDRCEARVVDNRGAANRR